MDELRMMDSNKFKISFLVDSDAMIKVYTGDKYGFIRVSAIDEIP